MRFDHYVVTNCQENELNSHWPRVKTRLGFVSGRWDLYWLRAVGRAPQSAIYVRAYTIADWVAKSNRYTRNFRNRWLRTRGAFGCAFVTVGSTGSSCMYAKDRSHSSMSKSTRGAAQHASARPATDRFPLGSPGEAVEKRDRRRSLGISPNRRQSGRRAPAASSHPQDRVPSMDGSVIETPQIFIGIDVSKSSWDVHLLPEGRSFTIRVDDGASRAAARANLVLPRRR